MAINKIGPNFPIYNNQPNVPEEDKQKRDVDFNDQRKEEDVHKEDSENLYDLDLKIKEVSSYPTGIELPPTGRQCGAQSEWPRCSNGCQTQRGHTCIRCEETRQGPTCFGAQCR